MAVEKLRVETAGFDLTLVPDDEDSALTGTPTLKLKKPLPRGLRAKDFIGKIVTAAESNNTKITLTSYVGYSPDKVSDVNITIGKKSNGSYPVSVSFVVDPA